MALGADGVQIGTLFALSEESSAHEAFKNYCLKAGEGDTMLSMKQLTPVRLLRNKFFEQVREAELGCASIDELRALLGKGRAKKGMFEGDLDEGELEIGQVVSLVDEIKPIGTIFDELLKEYRSSVTRLKNIL
jgi:enoyl-[acyl-carrier protein] reductase II